MECIVLSALVIGRLGVITQEVSLLLFDLSFFVRAGNVLLEHLTGFSSLVRSGTVSYDEILQMRAA